MRHPSIYRLAAVMVLATAPTLARGQGPVGTTFTYQGRVKLNNNLVTGMCDFQFGLFDVPTGGTALATQTVSNLAGVNGVFTAPLDFGAAAFTGQQRWIEVAVRSPPGMRLFVTVTPRQAVTAAPYAISTPGLVVDSGHIDLKGLGGPPGEIRLFPGGFDVERVRFTAGGFIGFGTIAPSSLLELSRNAPDVGLTITSTASGGHSWRWLSSGQGSANPTGSFSLRDVTAAANRVTVDANGNVGIGTTNPTALLDVNGTLRLSQGEGANPQGHVSFGAGYRYGVGAYARDNAGYLKIFRHDSGHGIDFGFATGDGGTGFVPEMTLQLGNVGIGTTSPAFKLDVAGAVHVSQGAIFHETVSANTDVQYKFLRSDGAGDPAMNLTYWGQFDRNTLALTNDAGSGLHVTTGGNVVVGNFVPGSNFTGSGRFVVMDGDVGIGTVSPQFRLHVLGGDVGIDAGADLYVGSAPLACGASGLEYPSVG